MSDVYNRRNFSIKDIKPQGRTLNPIIEIDPEG